MQFVDAGALRWAVGGDRSVAWTGLGGSRAIAIAGAMASSTVAPGKSRFSELSELDRESTVPGAGVVFVSASGDHPSMVRVARRVLGVGQRIGLLTLRPGSAMASLARQGEDSFCIAPDGDSYTDEFVADVNTRHLLGCLRYMWTVVLARPPQVPNDLALPDCGPMTPVRSGDTIVVYDDVGKAAATDFAVRAAESGIVCTLTEFHDFVHGSYAAIESSGSAEGRHLFVFAEDLLVKQLREVQRAAADRVDLHLIGIPGRCVESQIWSIVASQHVSKLAGLTERVGQPRQEPMFGGLLWKQFR